MSTASSTIRNLPRARAVYNQTSSALQSTGSSRGTLSNPARHAPRGTRPISTELPASPSPPNEAILRRRRHLPSSLNPKPTPTATRFVISTTASHHGQTEIDRHFHGALTCLHRILGDVPYGRTQGAVSRTPIQMLPRTDASCRESTLAFKVFNANAELRDRIKRELMQVEGVEGVKCEDGA